MNTLFRMRELIELINNADKAYFGEDKPIMTDKEYDALVEELTKLEKETGIHFKNSPIGKVGGEVKKGLTPVTHTKPMLSCNKTKDVSEIVEFAKENDVKTAMVLAPSTGYVCSDLLPNKHIIYKDDEYFEKAKDVLSDANVDFVDMREPLKNAYNDGTQVFYKTDHHWTSSGAYLAYEELSTVLGFEKKDKKRYDITQYEGFYGTTYSSSGFWLTKPDTIETWESKDIKPNAITVEITEGDETTTSDSMFYLENLKDNDKYPIYLDGNHPYTVIKNKTLAKDENSKKLLIIKDSFAHTLTPFLADHYAEIVMIDMRYYKQNVTELLEKGDFDNVLFVYSIDNLSTDSDLAFILN